MFRQRVGAALCASVALVPVAALADPALDLVQRIYKSLATEDQLNGLSLIDGPADRRTYMTERLAAVFDANDAQGEEPCIDFAPELDAQDYDPAEIEKTLKLAPTPGQDGAETIAADFTVFAEARHVVWSFLPVAGKPMLDDILGMDGSLAALDCTIH
jgi:hypothetical protein